MPRSSPLALTVLALLHYRPLHPYGIQRLIRQWGKDQVVNVTQRASLYRTIDRLLAEGLIGVLETERDPSYPERTVYEITERGRTTAHDWLLAMLALPNPEYPRFPAALSFALMLTPHEARSALERRAGILEQSLAATTRRLAEAARLPRVVLLETDYQRAVLAAELQWVQVAIADLRDGRLSWTLEELSALAKLEDPAVETDKEQQNQ